MANDDSSSKAPSSEGAITHEMMEAAVIAAQTLEVTVVLVPALVQPYLGMGLTPIIKHPLSLPMAAPIPQRIQVHQVIHPFPNAPNIRNLQVTAI